MILIFLKDNVEININKKDTIMKAIMYLTDFLQIFFPLTEICIATVWPTCMLDNKNPTMTTKFSETCFSNAKYPTADRNKNI
jgi:hypothetical protein